MIKFWAGATACLVGLCAGYGLASRNSSGTMTAINGPYTSGTVISSSVINARLADIETELTDSKSRSGKGDFTTPVRGADGTSTAPTYAFTSETTAGLYRAGSADLRLAFNGTLGQTWTSSGSTINTGWLRGPNGLVSAPSFSFTNDTGAGLYRIGSNDFGFAVNGVKVQEWNSDTTTTKIGDKLSLWGSTPTIGWNLYNNGSNRYMTTNIAAALTMDLTNGMIFYSAPSGSADAVATLTERMRVNASGVAIGSSQQFTVDGSGNVVSTATLKMASAGTAITQINFGTCTLNSGTPATCTATVNANSKCTANVVTTTAANTRDLGVTVSGTTLTVTSQTNGDAWQINYICMG